MTNRKWLVALVLAALGTGCEAEPAVTDAGSPARDGSPGVDGDTEPRDATLDGAEQPLDASGSVADAAIDRGYRRTPGTTEEVFVQLPSSAAGAEGIALRIAFPATASGARYREGAPIVVEVQGGHTASGFGRAGPMGTLDDRADLGFVSIAWVMPGGRDGTTGRASGGTFDYRGPHCARALADVLRFAQGELAARDDSGATRTLDEIVPYRALHEEIGILALSNGGNLAVVTLSVHGDELGGVRWYAGWENPVTDQAVTFELQDSRGPNPAYRPRSCTSTRCEVDYASVRLVPAAPRSLGSWDSPPMGAPIESLTVDATIVFDTDGSGAASAGEFTVTPRIARVTDGGPLKALVSQGLRDALAARGASAVWLASAEEHAAFWGARDAGSSSPNGHYDGAVAARPTLMTMVLATETDHGQPHLDDHPLAVLQYEGWQRAGAAFVRLNPDAVYLGGVAGFREAAPNAALDVDAIVASLVPDLADGRVSDDAIRELADRTHAGVTTNLDEVLWD